MSSSPSPTRVPDTDRVGTHTRRVDEIQGNFPALFEFAQQALAEGNQWIFNDVGGRYAAFVNLIEADRTPSEQAWEQFSGVGGDTPPSWSTWRTGGAREAFVDPNSSEARLGSGGERLLDPVRFSPRFGAYGLFVLGVRGSSGSLVAVSQRWKPTEET